MTEREDFNRAIDKIRDEMAKKGSGRYVQVVGEYLTDYLQAHPEAAGAILAEGKTIKGSLDAMRQEAQKHREGNVAVLDDAAAFSVVLKYFGIKGEATAAAGTSSAPAGAPSPEGKAMETADAKKPSPSGEGGATAPGEVVPQPDPFDLDALMGVL